MIAAAPQRAPAGAIQPADSRAGVDVTEEMAGLGARLQVMAEEQVSKRRPIERRWLANLRQYHGQYDPAKLEAIRQVGGSEAYVNLTRPKVNTMESRLADILLPTDDTNWGIDPTPKPELSLYVEDVRSVLGDAGIAAQDVPAPVMQRLVQKIARQRCDGMQEAISDALAESDYAGEVRRILHDAALHGTGILKGPVVEERTYTVYTPLSDGQRTVHQSERRTKSMPAGWRVNPWDFFPDMSATHIRDADFVFERHTCTRRQLRNMAKRLGFDQKKVSALMAQYRETPKLTDTSLNERRSLLGMSSIQANRFEVWEYHGPVEAEEWAAAGFELPEDFDAEELEVVAFVCEGFLLKGSVQLLETEERIYHVFPLEESDVSVFGFGVPDLMAQSEAVACATWRMLCDNAALSAGLQMVINRKWIEPADGRWRMAARKVWFTTEDAPVNFDARAAVQFFDVPNKVGELEKLFSIALRLIDEETMQPQIASGQQGTATKTAQGMTLLVNAANTVLRRVVKRFDDGITKPFIRQQYDWHMQYHDDESIKGDFQIVARGTTALLDKEGQIDSLLKAMQLAGSNPMLAKRTKFEEMGAELFRLMRVDPDRYFKSDEEMQSEAEAQGNQPPPVSPDKQAELESRERIEAGRLELAKAQLQQRAHEYDQKMQLAFADMDSKGKAQLDVLTAKLADRRMALDSKHRLFNAEASMKQLYGAGI